MSKSDKQLFEMFHSSSICERASEGRERKKQRRKQDRKKKKQGRLSRASISWFSIVQHSPVGHGEKDSGMWANVGTHSPQPHSQPSPLTPPWCHSRYGLILEMRPPGSIRKQRLTEEEVVAGPEGPLVSPQVCLRNRRGHTVGVRGF